MTMDKQQVQKINITQLAADNMKGTWPRQEEMIRTQDGHERGQEMEMTQENISELSKKWVPTARRFMAPN